MVGLEKWPSPPSRNRTRLTYSLRPGAPRGWRPLFFVWTPRTAWAVDGVEICCRLGESRLEDFMGDRVSMGLRLRNDKRQRSMPQPKHPEVEDAENAPVVARPQTMHSPGASMVGVFRMVEKTKAPLARGLWKNRSPHVPSRGESVDPTILRWGPDGARRTSPARGASPVTHLGPRSAVH